MLQMSSPGREQCKAFGPFARIVLPWNTARWLWMWEQTRVWATGSSRPKDLSDDENWGGDGLFPSSCSEVRLKHHKNEKLGALERLAWKLLVYLTALNQFNEKRLQNSHLRSMSVKFEDQQMKWLKGGFPKKKAVKCRKPVGKVKPEAVGRYVPQTLLLLEMMKGKTCLLCNGNEGVRREVKDREGTEAEAEALQPSTCPGREQH